MIRKLLAIALCVLLVLITCAAHSYAEPIIAEPLGPIEDDGLHVTFLLLEAACKEAIIPEHCDGIPVVSLEAGALDDFPQIERLHIPASITFIAEGVFAAHPNMLIVAEEGSYAWRYALENDLKLWLGEPVKVLVSYRSVMDSNTVCYSEEIECERGCDTTITAKTEHIPAGCSIIGSNSVSISVNNDGVASHSNIIFLYQTSATPTPRPTSTPTPKPTATPTPAFSNVLPNAQSTALPKSDIYNLPVYSGPGENYFRGANGRAVVDPKAEFDVWGYEGDWYLIRYNISKGKNRIGYIPNDGIILLNHELHFSWQRVETTKNTRLTDDPDGAQTKVCDMPKGATVYYLATYHGNYGTWYYVEYEDSDIIARGFIPEGTLE